MLVSVLQNPTLVLNRSWQPVNITSVARSMAMVYSGVARVVDPESYQLFDWEDWARLVPADGDPCIRAVEQSFRVPEVVSLVSFDRLPKSAVTFNRRNIFKRDRFTCQYCGMQPAPSELTIDHVLPRSRGGQSTWKNCVLACLNCNHRKADKLLEEAHMKLRKVPVQPNWTPAFSRHAMRRQSWQKFISDAYWQAELAQD